jgi:uncharacterized YccA/Bax inhibitor family protein
MIPMRTANPALNDKTFQNLPATLAQGETMTIEGTVQKTGFLLLLLLAPAVYIWGLFLEQKFDSFVPLLIGSLIGSLILSIATVMKKEWSPVTAPLYALCEGVLLGAISSLFELQYPGIVLQAVALTIGTAVGLLVAYTSGWIKATENFKLGVFAATAGIGLVYLASFVLRLFGTGIPYIHESGIIGIGFSIFVVIIAALNLVLDFDFIENGCKERAPKFMEWYAAFGLMVTLVWLYLEILRLLAKMRGRK